MAQTQERTRPEGKSPAKSAPATPAPSAPKPSLLARLRGPLTSAPSANGQSTNGQPRRGGTVFKSFFGILIWFVASQFIMYLLLFLDSALTPKGGTPPLQTSHLFPPNTPVLGGLTPFLLLYAATVIGLWFLLIRFNLIPRDFFNARAQAQQRAQRQSATSSASVASTGPKKTRAQRRFSETQVEAQASAKTKGGKNGASGAKPVTKPVTKPVAKPVAKAPAKVSDAAKTTVVASGTHDDEYDRVRSADRLRRRRESKR